MIFSKNKLFLLLLLVVFLSSPTFSQKGKKIIIKNADYSDFDSSRGEDFQRIMGNVIFQHDDAIMYCDSAYYFSEINVMEAFSNVVINQGDTLTTYGDYLKYNGETRFAELRNNVKMIDGNMTLTTDFLNYDRVSNIGYYPEKGNIIDNENNLTSLSGYYYTTKKELFFKDSVVLINPKYTMYSDTLNYNTVSEVATFFGPTTIVSDSNLIYCENGWYNTITDISQYNKNAYLVNKTSILKGDSLYYDRNQGFGEAFINIELIDTVENVILTGNHAISYQNPEYAQITDSAVFINVMENDTMFLHADTLLSTTYTDTIYYTDTTFTETDTIINSLDSLGTYKIIKGYHKCKIFKPDMQGMCDSLIYNFKDSIIELHIEPVIWSENNQMTAKYIEIHTKNSEADYILMEETSFIIQKEDSKRYNQIKGKKMIAYLRDRELTKIDVFGNGQTIYFPTEEDEGEKKLIGSNKAESSDMIIFMNDGVESIIFINQPDGILSPTDDNTDSELRLKDFIWLEEHRPKEKNDIFIWNK